MDSQSSYVSIAVHNNGTQNGLKRPMLPRKASKMAVSLAEACSGTVGKGEKTKNIFTKVIRFNIYQKILYLEHGDF